MLCKRNMSCYDCGEVRDLEEWAPALDIEWREFIVEERIIVGDLFLDWHFWNVWDRFLRFVVGQLFDLWWFGPFPISTLNINLPGSFLLSFLTAVVTQNLQAAKRWFILCGTGFFGAFTTFSTLQVDIILMFQQKQYAKCLLYVAGTYVGWILLSFLNVGCAVVFKL